MLLDVVAAEGHGHDLELALTRDLELDGVPGAGLDDRRVLGLGPDLEVALEGPELDRGREGLGEVLAEGILDACVDRDLVAALALEIAADLDPAPARVDAQVVHGRLDMDPVDDPGVGDLVAGLEVDAVGG